MLLKSVSSVALCVTVGILVRGWGNYSAQAEAAVAIALVGCFWPQNAHYFVGLGPKSHRGLYLLAQMQVRT